MVAPVELSFGRQTPPPAHGVEEASASELASVLERTRALSQQVLEAKGKYDRLYANFEFYDLHGDPRPLIRGAAPEAIRTLEELREQQSRFQLELSDLYSRFSELEGEANNETASELRFSMNQINEHLAFYQKLPDLLYTFKLHLPKALPAEAAAGAAPAAEEAPPPPPSAGPCCILV